MMDETEQVKAWIGTNFLRGPTFSVAPSAFESQATLFRAALRGDSFLASLINGIREHVSFRVPEGRYRYNELIRTVRRLTHSEKAYWFYVTQPQDEFTVLNFVQECNYEHALDIS